MSSTRLIIGHRSAWWGLGASGARRPGPWPPAHTPSSPNCTANELGLDPQDRSPAQPNRLAPAGLREGWAAGARPGPAEPAAPRPCRRAGAAAARRPVRLWSGAQSPLRAVALRWDPGGRAPECPMTSPTAPRAASYSKPRSGGEVGSRPAGPSTAQRLPLACPSPGALRTCSTHGPRPQATPAPTTWVSPRLQGRTLTRRDPGELRTVAPSGVTASGKSPLVKCCVVGQGTGGGAVGVRGTWTRGHTAVTRARSAKGPGQRGPGGGHSATSPAQRVSLRKAGSEGCWPRRPMRGQRERG